MKQNSKMQPTVALGIVPMDLIELGRVVSVLCIGVCDAIVVGAMTLDDAEGYLFNPYTLSELTQRGIGEEITGLIHLGTELSNVKRLLPGKFDASIADIKSRALECLGRYPPAPDASWIGWMKPI